MTGKLFGIILVICGMAGAVALWVLSKTAPGSNGSAPVRRFKLDHEYENKGFTEKGQSEGIVDVPNEISIEQREGFERDNFYSPASDTQHDNTPGDNF
ncbi:hypothetical protein K2895_002198 [Shigella sonnei]|uniref:hypothetical protein n=1 Tax=Escherichia coli TaxID=562 RepID=UPI0017E553EB|nr:hypothetical protein [Escherichia coli]EDW6768356.1 hypothetical protein [Salmonella enterica subsp. enterica serovar Johannesburg]EFV9882627.1 hypothetical protein [Shigella sonnei]EKJ2620750.1 hypothetical protein [Shigella flexneri]HAC8092686.1 hypothetical protein [Salmonella enterica subsp. enterica serovar Enteritidis]HBN2914542.1 hypothetical protein [Escherichia coli O25b:H4-ST131]